MTLDGSRQALEETARPRGRATGCAESVAAVAADPAAVRSRFPIAGPQDRPRPAADPDADPDDVHAWTVDDAARILLLAALGDRVEDELAELYRFGDAAERRGLLRALPYLPRRRPRRGLVDDAVRTNDTRLVAAALGPYATEHARRRGLRPGGAQVRLHRRADHAARRAARRARRRRPRGCSPRSCTSASPPAATSRPRSGTSSTAIRPSRRAGRDRGGACRARYADRREAAERALRDHHPRRSRMRIFEPHAHMTSRTTDDYEAMAASGVKVLVEPAFWLGQPRTSAGSFVDYFNSLLGWERFRAVAVRDPPPLHDRAQPEGGQRRRAAPRGARRCCRASWPRTASSRSARSATTR